MHSAGGGLSSTLLAIPQSSDKQECSCAAPLFFPVGFSIQGPGLSHLLVVYPLFDITPSPKLHPQLSLVTLHKQNDTHTKFFYSISFRLSLSFKLNYHFATRETPCLLPLKRYTCWRNSSHSPPFRGPCLHPNRQFRRCSSHSICRFSWFC